MTASICSMTGYARAEGETGGLAWAWELRSVNGRGLELRFRLPPGTDTLEPALRDAAGATLKRGTITANLTTKRDDQKRLAPDQAALDQVLAAALVLAARIPGAPPPRAEGLLALPGVLRQTSGDDALTPAQLEAMRAGFTTALAALAQARAAEGARLAIVLTTLLDEIAALCATAATQAAAQPAAQRDRMLAVVTSLLTEIPALPDERIAQEVAMLAARSDVREELDRLDAHLHAAGALMAEATHIGRRLDFLSQEFNREINTLCSKSASTALTTTGLKLKATLEQLREQVANVE